MPHRPALLLLPLLAAVALTGCKVQMVGTTTPDVVVVGEDVPSYRDPVRVPRPTYTYGSGSRNPVIQSFTANPTHTVSQGQPITFQVVAYDPTRDVLQYNWSATGGTLSTNSGQAVIWQPPTKAGTYTVMVTIANGSGGFVMGSLNLMVQADGTATLGEQPPATPAAPVTPNPTASPAASPAPSASPTPAASAAPTAAPTATPSAAAETGTILGTVRTDSGPISGATVTVKAGAFEASIQTDDIGNYRFNGVPANLDVTLSATKDGFTKVERTVKIVKGQEAFYFLDMKK